MARRCSPFFWGRGTRSVVRAAFPQHLAGCSSLAAVGLRGAGPCGPALCPCGLMVTCSESQKAEDLCPCLKGVDAHQRWGVFGSRVRVGMCQYCSGRHQASPSEDLCCKSVGQVRPRSSKGQSRPCISIQGLGSQSVEKSLRAYLLQGGRSGKLRA